MPPSNPHHGYPMGCTTLIQGDQLANPFEMPLSLGLSL